VPLCTAPPRALEQLVSAISTQAFIQVPRPKTDISQFETDISQFEINISQFEIDISQSPNPEYPAPWIPAVHP
jgi:hypothetical protein